MSEVAIRSTRNGLEVKAKSFAGHFEDIAKRELKDAIHRMVYEFTQECEVALRKLKPGETVTITGGPLEATLVAEPKDDPNPEIKKLEHQSA